MFSFTQTRDEILSAFLRPQTPLAFVKVVATADGDNTIIAAPAANQKLRVYAYVFTVTAAANPLIFRSGAAGTEHARFSLSANGGVSFAGGLICPAFDCDVQAAFVINNPAGVDTLGHVIFTTVAINQ